MNSILPSYLSMLYSVVLVCHQSVGYFHFTPLYLRLAIGNRSDGNKAPSSLGRVVNGLATATKYKYGILDDMSRPHI